MLSTDEPDKPPKLESQPQHITGLFNCTLDTNKTASIYVM